MIVNKFNAEHYIWGENCDGWHFLKNDNLSIIQERVSAGKSEKRHFHSKSRQFFYILKGTAAIEIEGTVHHLKPGQGIEVPPKTPHKFMNQSSEDVEFIVVSAPKSHGDRKETE